MSGEIITVQITDNVSAKLQQIPQQSKSILRQAMRVEMIALQSYVKAYKLSGQVLNVGHGRLRQSITQRVESDDSTVTGIVGTNLVYAAIHEYGFHGSENVREHMRRSSAQLSIKKSLRVQKNEGEITVKGFTRNMNMPERSYLRSSLLDQGDRIIQDLNDAIGQAIQ